MRVTTMAWKTSAYVGLAGDLVRPHVGCVDQVVDLELAKLPLVLQGSDGAEKDVVREQNQGNGRRRGITE